jgi:hypothetical protein
VRKVVPRRRVLKTSLAITGGIIGIGAAAAATRLWQTGAGGNLTAGPAYASWRAWDDASVKGYDGVITAATLASNAYNAQPWKFTVTDNIIDLHADQARRLGSVDPIGREMSLSLGCAVENMVLGAQAMGFTPVLNISPSGPNSDHIARMILFPGERDRPLEATALARRRTHRGLYTRDQKVETGVIDTLYAQTRDSKSRLVWLGADSNNGKAFAQATFDAAMAIVADEAMVQDSRAWFRRDLVTVNRLGDGLTLGTSGLKPLVTRLALTAPASLVDKKVPERWLMLTRDVQLATAPMFGLITVPDVNDRAALIDAGRLWQRLHLTGTLKGLSMQPMNQLMEIADRDQALQRPSTAATTLKELSGFADTTVAFGFRLGYSKEVAPPSPRRGMKQVLTT